MLTLKKSLLTLASALAIGGLVAGAPMSAFAQNPCAPKAANPCAKKANPCAKKANPCEKKANPCAKKMTNPCAANPCKKK